MKQFFLLLALAIFSIFVGSQITEGALLLPHWKSLSAQDFYAYYNGFGQSIGLFYKILTIIAALIPVSITVYSKITGSKGFLYALISSFLAILFVSSFYIYFKETNGLFFQGVLSETELKNELIVWGKWHWGRVVIECLSLVFLVLSLVKLQSNK